MLEKWKNQLSKASVIGYAYGLVALILSIHQIFILQHENNNFIIFRHSLTHLLAKQNLYIEYPNEYFDIFLYNPSFPILFSPFALLPESISQILWLFFTAFCVYFTIKKLPISDENRVFVWWFVLFELITAMQSQQTNPIVMCCMVLTWVFLEKNKTYLAAFFPVLAFFIKGYGVLGGILFLFYPQKGKFIIGAVAWSALLWCLPLLVNSPTELFIQYQNWGNCLAQDHTVNLGMGVISIIYTWFNYKIPILWIQLGGGFCLLVTLAKLLYGQYFASDQTDATIITKIRTQFLAYCMIWVIIFNHAAESPTFIIAAMGVALWFIMEEKTKISWIIISFVFVFSVLAPTDFFPHWLRKDYFVPYSIKAVPCIFVWVLLQIKLLRKCY